MRGEGFGGGVWKWGVSYFRDYHIPDGEEGRGDMGGESFGENVNLLGNSGDILGGRPGEHVDLAGEAG